MQYTNLQENTQDQQARNDDYSNIDVAEHAYVNTLVQA